MAATDGDDALRVADIVAGLSANLIVNGSFEQFDPASGSDQGGWWNVASIPGWRETQGALFEIVYSNDQVQPSEGSNWLDLDGQGYNKHIAQTIGGLTAGEQLLLRFDYANRTTPESGSFDVIWNGAVIASINDGTLAMRTAGLL
ncbi:hypothetical protein LTR94_033768, partial [Friedmanniomyces endolithicus]